jgi:hypothetical protein
MGATPDRHPGPLDEDEGITLEPQSVHPISNGQFRYVEGLGFRFFEQGVEKGLGGTLGVTENDFLLDCEPPSIDTDYAITRVAGKVTEETWTRTTTSALWKSINYSRTGNVVSSEVRRVYAADGTTILAQMTVAYVHSGASVVSATYTRDI